LVCYHIAETQRTLNKQARQRCECCQLLKSCIRQIHCITPIQLPQLCKRCYNLPARIIWC
jgi:hypothetical protein